MVKVTDGFQAFRFEMDTETHRVLRVCAALQGKSMSRMANQLIREGLVEIAKRHNITQETQHGRSGER